MEKTFKTSVIVALLYNEETGEETKEIFEYPYSVKDTKQRLRTRISRAVKKKYGDHVNLAGITSHRVLYELFYMPNDYYRSHSELLWSKELSREEVEKLESAKVHTKIPVEWPAEDADSDQE